MRRLSQLRTPESSNGDQPELDRVSAPAIVEAKPADPVPAPVEQPSVPAAPPVRENPPATVAAPVRPPARNTLKPRHIEVARAAPPASVRREGNAAPPVTAQIRPQPAAVSAPQSAAPPSAVPPSAVPPEPAPVVSAPPARMEPENQTPVPAPPAAPVPHSVTLNAGKLIPVRLVDRLSSERSQAGDRFTATLDRELEADGFVIAERGARVEGQVVAVDRGSKTKGDARIAIEVTGIYTSDGQYVPVQTDAFEKRSEPNSKTDAEKIGGGAVIGAIVGAIAGGGKGAAIGAGVGGGAGAGDVMLTRKPATLASETRISFRMRAPVTITEQLR